MATALRLTLAYPAVFTEEEDGYSVHFPDLDGCVTEGEDLDDAKRNAQEALTGFLESIFSRGFVIPTPGEVTGASVHPIQPMPHVAIPLLIRQARTAAGLTQEQLAARIGVSYQNYQRWENPQTCNISVRKLERICAALECELDVAFTNTKSSSAESIDDSQPRQR